MIQCNCVNSANNQDCKKHKSSKVRSNLFDGSKLIGYHTDSVSLFIMKLGLPGEGLW